MFSPPFYVILSLSFCLLFSMLLPLLISVLNSVILYDYFCTPLMTSVSVSMALSVVLGWLLCLFALIIFIICLIFQDYCLFSFVNSISEPFCDPFCDPVFLSLLFSKIVFMYERKDMLSLEKSTPIDWHHPWLWQNQFPLWGNHSRHGRNQPPHWRNPRIDGISPHF